MTTLLSVRPVGAAHAERSNKFDLRWNRARELLKQGRQVAHLFAVEIERLRATYLSEGHGGDRKSKNQVSHGETLDRDAGFQAAVERELGISKATAYRWMQDALRYRQMVAITGGEVTEIEGKPVTPEIKERAAEAVMAMAEDPSVRPARVWAGVMGGASTKGKHRAATDHARNISDAIAKLKTSLPHWKELPLDERHLLQQEWSEVSHLVEGRLE